MSKASKVITDAIVGKDFVTVVVNDIPYTLYPPTIHKIAGAISCLSSVDMDECSSFKDLFMLCKNISILAKALSWMIGDGEEMSEELGKGTVDEVVYALSASFSMISTEVFRNAVSLTKSASRLAAREKS